jgi:hypothetical protein
MDSRVRRLSFVWSAPILTQHFRDVSGCYPHLTGTSAYYRILPIPAGSGFVGKCLPWVMITRLIGAVNDC